MFDFIDISTNASPVQLIISVFILVLLPIIIFGVCFAIFASISNKRTEKKYKEIRVEIEKKLISAREFEDEWIVDKKERKGNKYHDVAGTYLILSYEKELSDDLEARDNYKGVYVGSSKTIYQQTRSHLRGTGNASIARDVENGLCFYVYFSKENDEDFKSKKELVDIFHAKQSYNTTY